MKEVIYFQGEVGDTVHIKVHSPDTNPAACWSIQCTLRQYCGEVQLWCLDIRWSDSDAYTVHHTVSRL